MYTTDSEIKQPRIEARSPVNIDVLEREENNADTIEEESRKMAEQEIRRLKFLENAIFSKETHSYSSYVGFYLLGGIPLGN